MSTCYDGALTGVDPATLQQWLSDAQLALQKLATGQRTVNVQVTGGGQHREVTFDKTSMAQLRAWINELRTALGQRPRRSALAVSF